MSFITLKILKFIIKAYGGIMRDEGSGKPEKFSDIRKNFIKKNL